jgi:hypothetical protein
MLRTGADTLPYVELLELLPNIQVLVDKERPRLLHFHVVNSFFTAV